MAPSSTTSFPASAGTYNTSGWNAGCGTIGFCGTYSDATTGVQKVEISIRQGASNYWNGTSFGSASEVWNTTSLAGGNWSFAFPASSFPADGSYTVRVKATDNATNAEAPASRTFTYDATNPSALFTFPASGAAYKNADWNAGCGTNGFCGTYSDATSGVQSVEISIRQGAGNYWNGSSFGSGSEVFQTASLAAGNWSYAFPASSFPADGSYTVHIRAKDNALNTETGPSRSFTIDNVDPSALFSFPASGGSYKTSDWNAGCGTNGFCGTYSDATSGVQSVEISIRQGAGNYWNGSSFGSGSEVFQTASLAAGNWSYAFPASSFPADGSYTVHIRAKDNALNTETGPSRSFTFDTTAPNTTIDSNPTDPSSSANANFTFSSTEGASTFECELDGGGFSSCSTPKSYAGLSEGSHTFKVRATDAAGNTDGSPAQYTWTVDTVAPNTTIDSNPTDPSSSANANFTFSSTEGASTFECEIDGGGFSSCSTPKSYAGLSEGSHTFEVRATDAAGNTDASPAQYTWTVDTIAPSSTTSFPGSGVAYNASGWNAGCGTIGLCGTYSDATSGVQKVEISIRRGTGNYWDGASFGSASEVWNTTSLSGGSWSFAFATTDFPADGNYTVRVRATDNAGNVESASSRSFGYDTAAPASTTSFPGSGGSYNTSGWNAGCATIGLCGTYSDATSGVQKVEISIRQGAGNYWNGTSFGSGAEVWNLTTIAGGNWAYAFAASSFPADGSYTIRVKATDNAGNGESPSSRSFTIDTAAPNTTIDSSPNLVSNSAAATFTFSSTEGSSTLRVRDRRRRLLLLLDPQELLRPLRGQPHLQGARHRPGGEHRRFSSPVHVDGGHRRPERGLHLPGCFGELRAEHVEHRLRDCGLLRHVLGRDLGRPVRRDLHPPGHWELLERHVVRERLRGLPLRDHRRRRLVVRLPGLELPRRRELHRARPGGRQRHEHGDGTEPNVHLRHDASRDDDRLDPERSVHEQRRDLHLLRGRGRLDVPV